jgi:hypothetical protein
MKLNVKALGLTCGVIWGLGPFLLTWWIIPFDGAHIQIKSWESFKALHR